MTTEATNSEVATEIRRDQQEERATPANLAMIVEAIGVATAIVEVRPSAIVEAEDPYMVEIAEEGGLEIEDPHPLVATVAAALHRHEAIHLHQHQGTIVAEEVTVVATREAMRQLPRAAPTEVAATTGGIRDTTVVEHHSHLQEATLHRPITALRSAALRPLRCHHPSAWIRDLPEGLLPPGEDRIMVAAAAVAAATIGGEGRPHEAVWFLPSAGLRVAFA
jgi:hypothetical protein